MENVCFLIAGQRMKVSLPGGVKWRRLLPSFVGFEDKRDRRRKSVCRLGVSTDRIIVNLSAGTLLAEFSQVLGEHLQLYEMNGLYVVNLQVHPDGETCRMLFAQSCVLHRTFLIHASVVAVQGKGYAFLGKSGTGKSTHSSLWLRHIGETELLNDDNPAVGIGDDGKVYIYVSAC